MPTEKPSRLEATRRRLKIARSAIVAASVAAFGGIAVAAKASHPATHGSRANVTSSDDDSYDEELDYGDGSISPALGSTPSFRSGSS
jgi:hypothetical protein